MFGKTKIISLTGVTASGKSTLAKALIGRNSQFFMVESVTTRAKKPSDISGEYRYVTEQAFRKLDSERQFLWTAVHSTARYGTPRKALQEIIERNGAIGIMILAPEAIPLLKLGLRWHGQEYNYVPFFLETPNEEELKRRLLARDDGRTDTAERLAQARNWESDARTNQTVNFRLVRTSGTMEVSVEDVLRAIIF